MGLSEELFERAVKVIPGGVNSPVRAYGAIGIAPRFIDRADGLCALQAILVSRFFDKKCANRRAEIMLVSSALPCPAMSSAVPWSTEVLM